MYAGNIYRENSDSAENEMNEKDKNLKKVVDAINNAIPITEDDFRYVYESLEITPVPPPEGKQGAYFRVRPKKLTS